MTTENNTSHLDDLMRFYGEGKRSKKRDIDESADEVIIDLESPQVESCLEKVIGSKDLFKDMESDFKMRHVFNYVIAELCRKMDKMGFQYPPFDIESWIQTEFDIMNRSIRALVRKNEYVPPKIQEAITLYRAASLGDIVVNLSDSSAGMRFIPPPGITAVAVDDSYTPEVDILQHHIRTFQIGGYTGYVDASGEHVEDQDESDDESIDLLRENEDYMDDELEGTGGRL